MKNYTVQKGDTLEGIAIKFLYRSALAYKIKQANNLPDNNVYPGQTLKIPEAEKIEAREYQGFKIVIDGKELNQTPPATIQNGINTIAPGLEFELPGEQIFDFIKPYKFNKVDVYFDNSIMFSGYISRIVNKSGAENKKIIEAHGKSHLLSRVNYPVSSYPRAFYNLTLKQIFTKFADLFNIPFTIEQGAEKLAGEKFIKVEIDPEQKVSDFLIDLAGQKGLILYGDSIGGIVLKNEYVKSDNILNIENYPATAEFNTETIFSDYTCLKNYDSEGNTQVARDKVQIDEFIPKVFQISKMQKESLKAMIKKEIKTDLINSFKLELDLPYITDINGNLIEINKQIYFKNEKNQIKGTEFIIKSAVYRFTAAGREISIDLFPVSFLKGEFEKFWE